MRIAKTEFSPASEDVTPLIVEYLKRQRQSLIHILDSSAGMGTAVKYIGRREGF